MSFITLYNFSFSKNRDLSMSFFDRFRREPKQAQGALPNPVFPKVQVIIHNPVVRSQNGRKFSELLKWNDPDQLLQKYITVVNNASYG